MEIRRAENRDIDGIMSLLYQVAEIHHKGRPDIFKGGCAKYTKEELSGLIADAATPILVAVENGKVLGHAFCVYKYTGDNGVLVNNKSMYIDDICVDENSRGKHIGSKLCKAVTKLAEENGCYNVTLNVWCLNGSAIEFYKAMGFKEQKIVMETVL